MMFWIAPAAGAFLALVAIAAGAIAVVRANKQLQTGLARVRATQQRIDPKAMQPALERLSADADAARGLQVRAAAAVADIRAGLRTLRMRRAVVALRVASLAVRALLASH
jgi:hypothetical protein